MRCLCGWHCARPLLSPAALCVGLLIFAAYAPAQGEPRVLGQSPATGYSTAADFQVWRTIALGTRKGVDAYRDALDAASIKVGDAADEILGRPAFPYARTKTEVELVLLSVAELGMEAEAASLSAVYKRAGQIGLELCPGEVGPQLRLNYRNQPLGEALHIAMMPVATYHGRLTILALTNFGGTISLIGNDGRPDFIVPRMFRFVFSLPSKQRLEVVKSPK
jgi:hypothetical protein